MIIIERSFLCQIRDFPNLHNPILDIVLNFVQDLVTQRRTIVCRRRHCIVDCQNDMGQARRTRRSCQCHFEFSYFGCARFLVLDKGEEALASVQRQRRDILECQALEISSTFCYFRFVFDKHHHLRGRFFGNGVGGYLGSVVDSFPDQQTRGCCGREKRIYLS